MTDEEESLYELRQRELEDYLEQLKEQKEHE
jgi:hypothetical protein